MSHTVTPSDLLAMFEAAASETCWQSALIAMREAVSCRQYRNASIASCSPRTACCATAGRTWGRQ